MLHNDREALYTVIQEMGGEPGIRRIRIFHKEGRITVSTEAGEVGTVVDKSAEACYGCHAQSAPLKKLNRPDRAHIFSDKQRDRVLGVIRPIENSAGCYKAACQVHPASQRVLGVVANALEHKRASREVARKRWTRLRVKAGRETFANSRMPSNGRGWCRGAAKSRRPTSPSSSTAKKPAAERWT